MYFTDYILLITWCASTATATPAAATRTTALAEIIPSGFFSRKSAYFPFEVAGNLARKGRSLYLLRVSDLFVNMPEVTGPLTCHRQILKLITSDVSLL